MKVSFPESFGPHDKFIKVPQIRNGDDSKSRTINGESIWNISREIPAYTYPIYRPHPKPATIPLQEILRKLMD